MCVHLLQLLFHGSPTVLDDGLEGSVDHCGVINGRKELVTQVKLVLPKENRPDSLDLNISKTLPYTPVTT